MDPIVQFTVSPEAPLSAKRSYMSDTSARNTRSSKTVSVEMPQLGESIIEGTVTAWLKNLGDQVTDGEPIRYCLHRQSRRRGTIPASGRLSDVMVNEDETVLVGTELALIETSSQQEPGSADTCVTYIAQLVSFKAPDWISTVTDPVVSRLLKDENDQIACEEPLMEVSTEHGDLSILSPLAGIVRSIMVAEDTSIRAGSILAHIEIQVAVNSPSE